MKASVFVLAAAALSVGNCLAAPFEDGERVAFLGDSITQIGTGLHAIRCFYMTRYPDRHIKFYNCGIGGDTAKGGLWRFEKDVKPFNPTAISVMFGMNDVKPDIYQLPEKRKANYAAQIEAAEDRLFGVHTNAMTQLYEKMRAAFPRAEIYWCVPSMYDETAVMKTEWRGCHPGANAALGRLGHWIRRQCFKDGGTLVDFHETMTDQTLWMQKGNPAYTLLNPDRIHPNTSGWAFMAYVFLKAQGVNPWVCDVEIDADKGEVRRCAYAKAGGLEKSDGKVTFRLAESTLPWVLPKWTEGVRSSLAIDRALNREMVAVTGLSAGTWELHVDGVNCGKWPAEEWAKGINFAAVRRTPMYQQSMKVTEKCGEYTYYEHDTFVATATMRLCFRDSKDVDFDNYESFKAYYERTSKGKGNKTEQAFLCWGKLDEVRAKLDALEQEARDLSRPKERVWELVRK